MSDPAIGPPSCGDWTDHEYNAGKNCPLEKCYILAGSYETDARYIYPDREKWWKAEAARLRKLLRRHGRHTDDCMVRINGECYCGWEELKRELADA